MMRQLVVVGTGIRVGAHMTLEARRHIEIADQVLFVVSDPLMAQWIRSLNARSRSLNSLYSDQKPRIQTYEEMVDEILMALRRGGRVCAVFYGHPGIYVYPSHQAISRARTEGFEAVMAPGISAEDCLYADLGFDPGTQGSQSYEATHFLVRQRRFDPYSALVLWQVGVIGDRSVRKGGTFNRRGIKALVDVLLASYPATHEVVLYEAAQWVLSEAAIERLPLARLLEGRIGPLSTLFVPPLENPPVDRDMIERLEWRSSARPPLADP